MLVKDLMTTNPACCRPSDTLDKVAKMMVDRDCGEIPVCDGTRLVGVITDRDITCRAVAKGMTPVAVPASQIMTRSVHSIGQHEDLSVALKIMEDTTVRRLPVIDESGGIVGIVSQADLVAKMPTLKVARLMRSVSKKTRHTALATLL